MSMKNDRATLSDVDVDHAHERIHSGKHFYISSFSNVASGGTVVYALTPPDTGEQGHILWSINGSSQTEFRLYEGADISGGDSITPINNNRDATISSGFTVAKGPTISSKGTLLDSQSQGLDVSPPQKANIESAHNRDHEVPLSSSKTTLLEITSRSDNNIVNWEFSWYETTPVQR